MTDYSQLSPHTRANHSERQQ